MNSNKKGRKIKYCFLGQGGTTLVELIVTFAMIGLFMTAATFMMTSSLRLFTRMQATSRAITVSDMILDKVAGEISAAVFPVGNPKQDDYYFWLDPNGEWVAFKNRLDSPVAIFAAGQNDEGNANTGTLGAGELFVRYYKLEGGNVPQQAELDWRYDNQVYMGYKISELNFSQANPGKDPGVIKINLSLIHKDTGFEYHTYRYARVYNTDYTGDYLGLRTKYEPENTGLPVAAKEFVIQNKGESGGGEDEQKKNTFRIHHMYGSTLILEEVFTGIPGTVMTIYAKSSSYPGFENYIPNMNSMEITVDTLGIERIYIFEYELRKEEEPFTVYFVSERTGKELGRKVYGDVELDKKFGIKLPYIAGYVTPNPEWLEIVFTDTVKSYIFYYEPILWDYTIYFWTRGNEELLPNQKGKIYTDDSIVVEAPMIPGYVPEFSNYTFTAVGDDSGGNEFTIYYDAKKADSAHPFVTKGNKIKVEKNDETAYWPWPQVAETVKEFFNSPWHKVEGDDKIGYYQIFVYDGREYAIGGWEGKEKDSGELEDIIKKHSGNSDCEVVVIKKKFSNSEDEDEDKDEVEVLRKLLLYCAKQVNATENELNFIQKSSIEFKFDDGVNLEEIEIKVEQHGSKTEIEIEYDD